MATAVVAQTDDFVGRLQSQWLTLIPHSLTGTGVVVDAVLIELQDTRHVRCDTLSSLILHTCTKHTRTQPQTRTDTDKHTHTETK